MTRAWLEAWPWESVVTINAALCREKNALHKPTTDGYEVTRKVWEDSRYLKLSLRQVLEICRRCHRLSPFCFYNGNTFVAIGRILIQDIHTKMSPVKAQAFRSVVGHYIAGTTGDAELDQALVELNKPDSSR
jgi:hypothetical protein